LLIINLDKINESLIYNNDICFPEVNFDVNSLDELIKIIKEYPKYVNSYKKRYDKFIKENGVNLNYEKVFKD
jgi:cytochrome c peroxidase